MGVKKKIKKSNYSEEKIQNLALLMCEKMNKELKDKKRLGVKQILTLVGAGVLSLLEFYPSNLYRYAKPYLDDPEAYMIWKRFNIPYLKRTLERLEKQKLIEIVEKDGKQIVVIKKAGKTKILKYSINNIKINKPKFWDGKWWIVSYDLPESMNDHRKAIRGYLYSWGFYPIHESVYLHAYPCKEEVIFLKEYFSIGKYLRIFKVEEIEDDKVFRDFFEV